MNRLEKYMKVINSYSLVVCTNPSIISGIPPINLMTRDVQALSHLTKLFDGETKIVDVPIRLEVEFFDELEGQFHMKVFPVAHEKKIYIKVTYDFLLSRFNTKEDVKKFVNENNTEKVLRVLKQRIYTFKDELKREYEFWNTEV